MEKMTTNLLFMSINRNKKKYEIGMYVQYCSFCTFNFNL